ncbi:MAG: hypothetical protein IMZ62_12770 [Chloroflexi bacterium]|nr:hypothetical protein [Chloroflexota bacterium]MBE3117507.1 hypothetical protein [Candidatus Atribacteria bacterium]
MQLNTVRSNTWVNDLVTTTCIIPVHASGDDGHEFVILDEGATTVAEVQDKLRAVHPGWLKANPVVRFAHVRIAIME